VQFEEEFFRWDVYSAFDVASPVVIVADVNDEVVFGLALDESFELLRGYELDHPLRPSESRRESCEFVAGRSAGHKSRLEDRT